MPKIATEQLVRLLFFPLHHLHIMRAIATLPKTHVFAYGSLTFEHIALLLAMKTGS